MAKWLQNLGPYNTKHALFVCFPYAGGNSSMYQKLALHFNHRVNFCAIQMPARGSRFRESPIEDITSIADIISYEIKKYFPKNLPVILFGHSFGALLAYEVAIKLGEQSKLFFTSCMASPNNITYKEEDKLHLLSDEQLIKKLSKIPHLKRVNDATILLALPSLRADYKMCELYFNPKPKQLNCPIVNIVASEDSVVKYHLTQDWKSITKNSYKPVIIPGNHYYVHESLDILSLVLHTCLYEQGVA